MTIQAGDIIQLASKVMDDVPEGGGGPSGNIIPFGQNNTAFDDITETDRAGGDVSIRQMFSYVRTPGVERLLDAHIIVSHLPSDPNVSITLAACAPFAKRSEIAQAIANYLIPGSEWGGFLLEDHVADQRSLDICHRIGTPAPTDGRTLLLIQDEGKATEKFQYVRIVSSETTTRTFTYNTGSGFVDYQVSVTQCILQDPLRFGFKGSPPSKTLARATDAAMIRDTRVADASVYYGASPLTAIATMDSSTLLVDSIYTQVVPNSRAESAVLDQRPAAQRPLSLSSAPRAVDVAVTPHSWRIRVTQENRGYVWTAMLRPLPAAGTISIEYMAMGDWNTITEDLSTVTSDGSGTLTGDGSGTVKYQTGSLSVTLKVMPDVGSSIIIFWGERSAYTNRSGQAGYRAPEFAWAMPHQCIKPGSVVVTWISAGVLKTATDDGNGGLTGDATGEIDYAAGKLYLRPNAMIDPGGEFLTSYEYGITITQNFNAPAVDAGGFASLPLDQQPAPKSIVVRWITVRNVSSSSGTSEIVSNSGNGTVPPAIVDVSTPPAPGNILTASTTYAMPGNKIAFTLQTVAPQTAGTYTWSIDAYTMSGNAVDDALVLVGGATTGTFSVTPKQVSRPDGGVGLIDDPTGAGFGSFVLTLSEGCPDLRFSVWVKNQALTAIASSPSIAVDALGNQPAPAWDTKPPPPVITTREPVIAEEPVAGPAKALPLMAHAGWASDTGARVFVKVQRTVLDANSLYADVDGMGYDLPEVYEWYWDESQQKLTKTGTPLWWSPSDFAAGHKTITSVAGVPTTYYLWS